MLPVRHHRQSASQKLDDHMNEFVYCTGEWGGELFGDVTENKQNQYVCHTMTSAFRKPLEAREARANKEGKLIFIARVTNISTRKHDNYNSSCNKHIDKETKLLLQYL